MWNIQTLIAGEWRTRWECSAKWLAERHLDILASTIKHYDYRLWRVVWKAKREEVTA